MLCASELESRQSEHALPGPQFIDALRLGIGIKAKLGDVVAAVADRCSAPRNWNQGKATRSEPRRRPVMLCASELESRQSRRLWPSPMPRDALRLGIGIKAKRACATGAVIHRCSAPRNWNQGKARFSRRPFSMRMLCASELESRQSKEAKAIRALVDALRLGIGIKAKLPSLNGGGVLGCSAPRNWNQGKA